MFRRRRSCDCIATVLVVEDIFYNVVPVRVMLKQSFGITIERACNGQQGVDFY